MVRLIPQQLPFGNQRLPLSRHGATRQSFEILDQPQPHLIGVREVLNETRGILILLINQKIWVYVPEHVPVIKLRTNLALLIKCMKMPDNILKVARLN